MEKMKIIIVIFFIASFTNFITAETCNQMKIRQLKDVKISKIKKQKYYAECLLKEKRDKGYWVWRESVTWASNDAYYIPKNTISCTTKKSTIEAFNYLLEKGGYFYLKQINRYWSTCGVLDGWTIARIIQMENKSNVIKVQYQIPLTNSVAEKYIVQNSIMLLADYKKTLAH